MNFSVKPVIGLLAACLLSGCGMSSENNSASSQSAATSGQIEVVAEMAIRPGNVTATGNGRVFTTIHPMDGERGVQLVEIIDTDQFRPWPSKELQSPVGHQGEETLDTPLGIAKDNQGGLWVVDMGLHLGKTRIWGFDIASGELIQKLELPANVAPKGSFVQDLAVDRERGWIYLADIINPSIIAVELKTGKARRFGGHPSLEAETGARMVIEGQPILFAGQPVKTGINPITLSQDGETLYFGAMSGTSWYQVPARLFRDMAGDQQIAAAIQLVGKKPVSDGAATDAAGNHFFTNLNDNGIDRLSPDGKLTPVARDARFSWPDNVQTGEPGWLYVAVNQLHKTPPFSEQGDIGQPPYYIFRIRIDE